MPAMRTPSVPLTPLRTTLAVLAAALTLVVPAAAQVSVLTQHNDTARSGANMAETTLTTSNVNAAKFGKLFSMSVDGFVFAQPLYAPNLTVNGANHNVLFVATAHDSVYAFDADTGVELWRQSLGAAVPNWIIGTANIQVEVGIISTPVIDAATGTIYVVAKTYEQNAQVFRLHALSVLTGDERTGSPVVLTGSVPGNGQGAVNGVVPFQAEKENQRPSLTLANGKVYIAFASHEDYTPYHGWVIAYDKATLQQTAIFNDTPDSGMGGIWMSGQGLVVDGAGSLYCITGNSAQGSENNAGDYGESFIKLSPALALQDYFKANNYDLLNAWDADLGSGGAMAIPGTKYIVGGGKMGVLYVLDTTNMGGLGSGVDHVVQEWQADNGLWGDPVFWNSSTPTLYVWSDGDNLKAFPYLGTGLFNTTPSSHSNAVIDWGDGSGGLSLTSNGSVAGSGVVWAATPLGDPDHGSVPGQVYAFDASNLANELWDSGQNAGRDGYGSYAKWVAPTVVNGKAYVATDSGQVVAYGLLPPPSSTPGDVISVDFVGGNGPILQPSPMAPNETAGIFGDARWNNAVGAAGSIANLSGNGGAATGVSVSWNSGEIHSLPITENGATRMMAGYLDTPGGVATPTTVSVSNIPTAYRTRGYTVYVYCDGDNGGETRTGNYTLGAATLSATDPSGVDFGGIYTVAAGSNGNVVAFPGQTAGSFSLTAVGTGTDANPRAPVNGIQIRLNVPQVIDIVPNQAIATGPSFTLTVDGALFTDVSKVTWNGTLLPTTFVSATQLTATVPASDILTAGTAQVGVTDGGFGSNTVPFTIVQPPSVSSLTPSSAPQGSPALTMLVSGANFTRSSVVYWNANPLPTTVLFSTILQCVVPAADMTTGTTATITVHDTGAISNGLPFKVVGTDVPVISSLAPPSAVAGGGDFTLTVNGSGFDAGAVVNWNGVGLPSTFVSATRLTAAVPAADIASIGTASVTVLDGSGNLSTPQVFSITGAAAPSITSLSPSSATVGGAAFVLTVNGANFSNASTVAWNAVQLPTTFISSNQVTANVPAANIAQAGTAQVLVDDTGAGASNVVSFPITASSSHTFAPGLQLLSAPLDFQPQTYDQILDVTGVEFAVWVPALLQYALTPASPANTLAQGHGYWARFPSTVHVVGTGVDLGAGHTTFGIALAAGWNMIGDPKATSAPLSSLTVSGAGGTQPFLSSPLVSPTVYAFDSGTNAYTTVSTLDPWVGCWVFANQACTLNVPE